MVVDLQNVDDSQYHCQGSQLLHQSGEGKYLEGKIVSLWQEHSSPCEISDYVELESSALIKGRTSIVNTPEEQ